MEVELDDDDDRARTRSENERLERLVRKEPWQDRHWTVDDSTGSGATQPIRERIAVVVETERRCVGTSSFSLART